MSDKVRRTILVCLLAFAAVACFLVVRTEKHSPSQADPSALPPPSREFDQWHKNWEKQR